MTSASDGTGPGDLPSDEAFELIGNAQRIKILRALWESPDETVSFSTLRTRAGIADSGQFNYHLDKLLGTFVRKTDEGYRPRRAVTNVIRAILAGAGDGRATLDGVEVDGRCAFCDGGLAASYETETAVVRCRDCGKIQLSEWLPPAAFDGRSGQEVVRTMDRWVRHRTAMVIDGVCPDCGGKPARTLFESRSARGESHDYLRANYVCETCSYECDVPVWLHVLLARHPGVAAFYRDRGVNLDALPTWELTRQGHAYRVAIESEDPLRIGVAIPLDGDVLHVQLNSALEPVSTTTQGEAPLAADD